MLSSLLNPFLAELVGGIRNVADSMNYRLMITVGRDQRSIEVGLIESMIDHQMDGLILISPSLPSEAIAKYAKEIPIVCIAYCNQNATEFDTINVNDFRGAEIAVQHLLDQGIKNIAMFTHNKLPSFETSVQHQREMGYRDLMNRYGAGEYIQIYAPDMKNDQDITKIRELLNSKSVPEAIFCWSDLDALVLLQIANEENIRIPEDILVVGFDNSRVADIRSREVI